jgi:hypothetical protein
MKKKNYRRVTVCAMCAGMLLLAACGNNKADVKTTAAASTAALKTTAAPAVTKAPETTAAPATTAAKVVLKAELNYDYADMMGENYKVAVGNFGTPLTEDTHDVSRLLSYANPDIKVAAYTEDESVNTGREDAIWLIETSVGDLFKLNAKANTAEEFAAALDPGIKISKTYGNNIEGYEFGDKTENVYTFESDGYQFEVLPNTDGSIDQDNRAVIISRQDAEEPEEAAEETTKKK